MNEIRAIAKRQFRSYFNGPTAYIVLCLVLLILGFFFWKTFFLIGRASMREMFRWLSVISIFSLPALTMGLLAEEKRTGTIELLITMPVTEAQVIIGKFLGVLGLFGVLLLLTLPYPISVATLGDLDWGPVFTGYLGLFFLGAAILAIGLAASSATNSPLLAFFVTMTFAFVAWIADKVLPLLPARLATTVQWISFDHHFQSMSRGVIDPRDVVFFGSIVAIGLLLAFRALESRRWS
ncbi:MAG: ABC transporter permease [Polyangiales bacterium]